MPLSTPKVRHLFVVDSSFGASHNKGFGNVDKMGNFVKKKTAETRFFCQNAKKVTKISGLTCSPREGFLPGPFEGINLCVNNFFTCLVFYC